MTKQMSIACILRKKTRLFHNLNFADTDRVHKKMKQAKFFKLSINIYQV